MNSGTTAYQKAQELAATQKNEAALVAFEEAARQEPNHFRAIFGQGLMLQRLELHSEAVAAFTNVVNCQSDVAEVYYSRALSFSSLGRDGEALVDLDRALALRADYPDARYARGICLRKLGRLEEACSEFSEVLSTTDQYPEASHGRACIRYGKGDYVGAIEDFTHCVEQGLDGYDVRLMRGLAFFHSGRLEDAIADLSDAISLRPELGSTYIRRWQVYLALGDAERAAEDLRIGNKLLT